MKKISIILCNVGNHRNQVLIAQGFKIEVFQDRVLETLMGLSGWLQANI